MSGRETVVDVTVRMSTGAYVTSTTRGQRASCTHSAEEAAKSLGRKLYGDGFRRAVQQPQQMACGMSVWRLHGVEPGNGGSHVIL